MRAQRRAEAKWARTESQTEDDEREARSKVEWNGQGDAVTVLKDEQPPTEEAKEECCIIRKRRSFSESKEKG